MSGDYGVTVEGIAMLSRTMRKAGEDLTDLKDANARAAAIVSSAAAGMAPRRTGRLAASIRGTRAAARARVVAGRASVPYAAPIHWGWPARHIKQNPFLSDAARATEPQWLPQYLKDIDAALDNVKGD